MIDVAFRCDRRAGPLADNPLDDHDPLASLFAEPHLVTGPDGVGGLDPRAVDPDVPGPAGTGRGRAGLDQPHRPDPAVDPSRLVTRHVATVMRLTEVGDPQSRPVVTPVTLAAIAASGRLSGSGGPT